MEAQRKIVSDLKSKANLKYEEIKLNMDKFKTLSMEYVKILKEIETEMVKPNFS